MIRKHFTASEQMALSLFNRLNSFVKEGLISILEQSFSCFEEMITNHIYKDKDHDWRRKRDIIFIHRHHPCNFIVKIVLRTMVPVDSKDRTVCWLPERIAVGKINYYWDFRDDWKIVEYETVWYSDSRQWEKPATRIENTNISLKEFIRNPLY